MASPHGGLSGSTANQQRGESAWVAVTMSQPLARSLRVRTPRKERLVSKLKQDRVENSSPGKAWRGRAVSCKQHGVTYMLKCGLG